MARNPLDDMIVTARKAGWVAGTWWFVTLAAIGASLVGVRATPVLAVAMLGARAGLIPGFIGVAAIYSGLSAIRGSQAPGATPATQPLSGAKLGIGLGTFAAVCGLLSVVATVAELVLKVAIIDF